MAICRLADHFDCRSTARAVDFEIRYIKRGKKYIEFGKRSIRMFAGGEGGAEGKFGQTVHVRVFPVNWFSWLRVLSAILEKRKEKFRSALIRKPVRIHASPLSNAFRFIVSRAMRRDRGGGRKVSKIARFYFEIPRGTTLVSCRMLNTIKERNEMTRFSFRFLLVSLLIIADSLCSWNFNRCFSWDIV